MRGKHRRGNSRNMLDFEAEGRINRNGIKQKKQTNWLVFFFLFFSFQNGRLSSMSVEFFIFIGSAMHN